MKLADLPAADQRAVRTGRAAAVRPAVRAPAQRARRPDAPRATHTCGLCGRTFGAYPSAERHVDEQHTGAVRIECAL